MLSWNGGAKRILVLSQADHEFFDEIQSEIKLGSGMWMSTAVKMHVHNYLLLVLITLTQSCMMYLMYLMAMFQ